MAMTWRNVKNLLNNVNDERLDNKVTVIAYGIDTEPYTTAVEIGDWTTDELYVGAYFGEAYEEVEESTDNDRFVEIYPNNRSGRKFSERYFESHENYNACMEWHKEGNEIVVILDTKTNTEAVYERLGGVYCLDDRFGIYCNVDVDDEHAEHNEAIRKMLVDEAIAAGFPMECPANAETDRTYTCTFTRAQMRESAAALGHVLTDEQCDTLAGYASMDVVDEARMGGYLSFGMQDD